MEDKDAKGKISNGQPSMAALLDVAPLDDSLLSLLVSSPDWRPLLHLVTILYSRGQTPAARALGLEFRSRRLWWYALLVTLVPTSVEKLRVWYEEHRQSNHYSLERKLLLSRWILRVYDVVSPIVRLSVLLACWNGWIATADPAMVLTGSTYTQTREPKMFVDYAHRRWLAQRGMDTLKVMFGGLALWRFWFRGWRNQGRRRQSENGCCKCGDDPIIVPREASCGHMYCYVCLPSVCLVCRAPIQSSRSPR